MGCPETSATLSPRPNVVQPLMIGRLLVSKRSRELPGEDTEGLAQSEIELG